MQRQRVGTWQAYKKKCSKPLPRISSFVPQFSLNPYDPANDKAPAFHASQKRIKLLLGGNRSSKTESSIYDDLTLLHTPRTKILIATVSTDMIGRVLWPKIQKYLPQESIKKIAWINPARQIPGIITTHNDSQIHLLSYEMGREKFQGFGGFRRIHFDEESNHDIWIEAVRGIIDSGGDAVLSMTPLKGLTWVYTQYYQRRGLDPNLDVWTMSLLENKHISQADKDFYISQLSADEIRRRVYGEFLQLSGSVFKEFDPQIHVIDAFDIPTAWRKIRAIDLGFNNPFVCLWIAQGDDDVLYIYNEHYQRETLVQDHADIIRRKDYEWIGAYSGRLLNDDIIEASVCDHEAQTRAELDAAGIGTIPADKQDKALNIQRINRRLKVRGNGKPGMYIFRHCVNTIREWQAWVYGKNEDPVKIDDHTCDAGLYGNAYFEPHYDDEFAGAGERVFTQDVDSDVNLSFF